MFYSAQILSKKGPLGPIWIASWSQGRLKRTEVFNCSLPAAVDSIINPEAPLALRLSGQLLLGLVRLYLRKLQLLEEDAGLALRGLARNAAGGGGTQVDLPDGGLAPEMAITLQDGMHDPMAQFVGNELFPSFEGSLFPEADAAWGGPSTGAARAGGSVTVAADISELFGSHWTGPGGADERLDADGDAMERRFSMELERLRSQGIEAPRDPKADLFFGAAPDEAFSPVMDDEVMAVPPEDMLLGPAPTPGRTPGSAPGAAAAGAGAAAPLPGLSDMRITPPSLPGLPSGGAADLLPDLGGGASGATSAGGFELGGDVEPLPMEGLAEEEAQLAGAEAEAGAQQQRQQRQRRAAAPRRRRATVDASATLPSDQIRALLADRKPLLVARGLRARRQAAGLPPRGYDVAAQSEAARDSELFRPAAFAALAPELLQLFGRAMQLPGQCAAGEDGPAAQRRRRSSRGGAADEEEAAAAAAEVAAEAAAEAELRQEAPFSAGGFSDAAPFSAGGWADDYPDQEPTQELGAGAFPPGPEDEAAAAEEGGEAGAAAERRGRLPLQPVASSGELGSIGPDSSGSGAAQAHATAFTRNTALVLEHLRREFAPPTGSKRRHPSAGDLAAGLRALSLDGLLSAAPGQEAGGRRGRLEAARWFYESLVLRNAGFVSLSQDAPYGDIQLHPTPALAGGAGTPAGGAPPAP